MQRSPPEWAPRKSQPEGQAPAALDGAGAGATAAAVPGATAGGSAARVAGAGSGAPGIAALRRLLMPRYTSPATTNTLTTTRRTKVAAVCWLLSCSSSSCCCSASCVRRAPPPLPETASRNCSIVAVGIEADLERVGPDEGAAEDSAREPRDIVALESLERRDGDFRRVGEMTKRDAALLARRLEHAAEIAGTAFCSRGHRMCR